MRSGSPRRRSTSREFLAAQEEYVPPQLDRVVLAHGHCHASATGGVEPERALLERARCERRGSDSGCCGMAGAWGYERAHYDVSLACGERVLLPAVRDAADSTVILASGFSCRHQIEQGSTGRRALHLAQVLKVAREFGAVGPPGRPEDAVRRLARRRANPARAGRVIATAVALAAAGGLAALLAKRA